MMSTATWPPGCGGGGDGQMVDRKKKKNNNTKTKGKVRERWRNGNVICVNKTQTHALMNNALVLSDTH